jgi:hypothetical protein
VPATSKSDGIPGTHCAIQQFTIITPSLQCSSLLLLLLLLLLLWCCRVCGFPERDIHHTYGNVNPGEPGRTVCRDTMSFGCSAYSRCACKLGNPACIKSLTLDLPPDKTPAQTTVSLTVLSLVFSVPPTDCRLTLPCQFAAYGVGEGIGGPEGKLR